MKTKFNSTTQFKYKHNNVVGKWSYICSADFASFLLCMYVWRIMYACVCATRRDMCGVRGDCCVDVDLAGVFRCCATAAARPRDSIPYRRRKLLDGFNNKIQYIYTIHKVIYLLSSCICMHYCICICICLQAVRRTRTRTRRPFFILFCFVHFILLVYVWWYGVCWWCCFAMLAWSWCCCSRSVLCIVYV